MRKCIVKSLAGKILAKLRGANPAPDREITPDQRKTGCLLATLGITFRCMCKCAHCGSAAYRANAQDELSLDEIKRIIAELRQNGANSINFFGGEPLIRKDLLEMVRYTKNFGMGTAIDTNGYLLDREMAFKLAEAGMDMVHVSIDSADPAKHDEMRGVSGLHERAVNAIKFCHEAGMTVRIGAYVDRERLENGEFARLIELARELNAPLRILTPVLTGRWQDADDMKLTPEEKQKFRSMLEPGVAYWEQELCNSSDADFVCACLVKDYIYITAYGEVAPCVYIPVTFGNVCKESLDVILKRMWDSDLFKIKVCNECLSNTRAFREKYVNYKGKPGTYPQWMG